MKIALLSDIHANEVALAATLEQARIAGAEQLLCCGDFVGYYHAPEAMLELLDGWSWQGIRGNHEDMLEHWLEGTDRDAVHRRYGSGIAIAAGLPESARILLLGLPARLELTIDDRQILLCHGSAWDPNHYVYPDASEEERRRMAGGGQDLVVFGHSHYPVVWRIGRTIVVNPGSVGQPRDRKPGACWALWDTRTMEVTLQRTQFDTQTVAERARRIDPHLPYLADVLTRQ
ncbi:MAG TPA: metallophosphoesterase family protein [Dongiaceae bacterium]|jgi:putative phosphoesterase|nr:metallophosphoesterase family protein [Dongiaceae bacterium]